MRIEGISETTDADLVTEVVAGDAAAFAHLVRRHAPMAKRMAVFWGAGADSDDVVQEAFVKAYAALPRFRSDSEFRPWLLCIVRNETRNLFRGRTRRAAREEMARSLLDLPVRWQALLGLREAGLERGHAHRRGRPRRGMDRRYPRDRLYRSGRN